MILLPLRKFSLKSCGSQSGRLCQTATHGASTSWRTQTTVLYFRSFWCWYCALKQNVRRLGNDSKRSLNINKSKKNFSNKQNARGHWGARARPSTVKMAPKYREQACGSLLVQEPRNSIAYLYGGAFPWCQCVDVSLLSTSLEEQSLLLYQIICPSYQKDSY